MSKRDSGGERRPISPKDVFERSNMPSRWERLTGVSPKIAEDTLFLAFVAARYLGEQRLPHPAELPVPEELGKKQKVEAFGGWVCAAAVVLGVIGLAASQPVLFGLAAVALTGAVVAVVLVSTSTAPAIREFTALKARCVQADARLRSDSLDPEYRSALNAMINCDEGTLAYCAAKIASEVQRQIVAESAQVELVAIDLWDELDEIATSAREITEDREETERLAQSRLRDRPEVRETLESDRLLRAEAIGLLAARVDAFADYRDRVHLLGSSAWRDNRITRRALRLTSDELAARDHRRRG